MTKPRGKAPSVTPARAPWGEDFVPRRFEYKSQEDCKGCIHLSGTNRSGTYHCNYLANTGVSRVKIGAKAGPKGGCAVKDTGKKVDRRFLSNAVSKRRMEMYEKGFDDAQIAAAFGVHKSAIANWRLNHGLPSHKKPGGQQKKKTP